MPPSVFMSTSVMSAERPLPARPWVSSMPTENAAETSATRHSGHPPAAQRERQAEGHEQQHVRGHLVQDDPARPVAAATPG